MPSVFLKVEHGGYKGEQDTLSTRNSQCNWKDQDWKQITTSQQYDRNMQEKIVLHQGHRTSGWVAE